MNLAVQSSMSQPPQTGVLAAASNLVLDVVFGPVATAIAILAIASIGFAMLFGRVDVRRGLTIVLGCFVLFGAREIAAGFMAASLGDVAILADASAPPPPNYAKPLPTTQNKSNDNYDPYAGASVIR